MYKAKNVDTDKALDAIDRMRVNMERASSIKIEKEKSYLEGVHKGLDFAWSIFTCSNYEKNEKTLSERLEETKDAERKI